MYIMFAIAVVIVLITAFVASKYNTLVSLKNRFENAFAQIEVQLKRRHDLIPNLVETAKAYMKHERETLEEVISARNVAAQSLKNASSDPGSSEAIAQLSSAEMGLTGAMGRLFAVMESYPDLKANQNMMQLSEELTSTENKVAFSRQAFNDAVTAFNVFRQSFPTVLIAGLIGYGSNAELLSFEGEAIHKAPDVSFE